MTHSIPHWLIHRRSLPLPPTQLEFLILLKTHRFIHFYSDQPVHLLFQLLPKTPGHVLHRFQGRNLWGNEVGGRGGRVQSLSVSRQQGSVCVRVLSKHRTWHNNVENEYRPKTTFWREWIGNANSAVLRCTCLAWQKKKKHKNITFDNQPRQVNKKTK